MKHVNLDRQDESVQRVIGAAACEEWTEAKNARRCDLIDKEVTGTLNAAKGTVTGSLNANRMRVKKSASGYSSGRRLTRPSTPSP